MKITRIVVYGAALLLATLVSAGVVAQSQTSKQHAQEQAPERSAMFQRELMKRGVVRKVAGSPHFAEADELGHLRECDRIGVGAEDRNVRCENVIHIARLRRGVSRLESRVPSPQ